MTSLCLLSVSAVHAQSASNAVSALAVIEPAEGILELSGPPGDRLAKLLVKEGDKVQAGQVIATFESLPALEAELELVRAQLRELKVTQPWQRQQLEANLEQAKTDYHFAERQQKRYDEADIAQIAAKIYDEYAHRTDNARNKMTLLQQELATLEARQEVALALASARVKAAESRIGQAKIVSPRPGTILEVLIRPGENSGGHPILRMADLSKMSVIADVFETDLTHIRVGQKAYITAKTLPTSIEGTVQHVGRIISPQGKVGKVRILADKPEALSALLQAEVDVSIQR